MRGANLEAGLASPAPGRAADIDLVRLRARGRVLGRFAQPDTRRAIVQVLNTALPFLALMAAIFVALGHGIWPALVLAVPASALLVRLFAIQHDCGHGSFFRSRRANDILGWTLGVLTLTPYASWRRSHATHHATSGNLDRRAVGDIDTMTVEEYRRSSAWRRLAYRLYRHPLVLFGIGPAYMFVFRHRLPTGMLHSWRTCVSDMGNNLATALLCVVVALAIGVGPFLAGYLPVVLMSATAGIWLFYIQHQFEDTYWESDPNWSFEAAAMKGCSFYDLPGVLHWVTGHIGLHHIHHLASRIPNYRLRECFEQVPELRAGTRLTLLSSLRCARLALWDEEQRKLVPFAALSRR